MNMKKQLTILMLIGVALGTPSVKAMGIASRYAQQKKMQRASASVVPPAPQPAPARVVPQETADTWIAKAQQFINQLQNATYPEELESTKEFARAVIERAQELGAAADRIEALQKELTINFTKRKAALKEQAEKLAQQLNLEAEIKKILAPIDEFEKILPQIKSLEELDAAFKAVVAKSISRAHQLLEDLLREKKISDENQTKGRQLLINKEAVLFAAANRREEELKKLQAQQPFKESKKEEFVPQQRAKPQKESYQQYRHFISQLEPHLLKGSNLLFISLDSEEKLTTLKEFIEFLTETINEYENNLANLPKNNAQLLNICQQLFTYLKETLYELEMRFNIATRLNKRMNAWEKLIAPLHS